MLQLRGGQRKSVNPQEKDKIEGKDQTTESEREDTGKRGERGGRREGMHSEKRCRK